MEIGRVGIHEKGEVTLQDLITLARNSPETRRAGAIATFTGIVRGYTHEGKEVEGLYLEAYREEAERALERISEDLRARPGVVDVLIHHMIGEFSVGEDIVYVVVSGVSRKDVFPTLIEAVERYKREAAIWKKEHLKDGEAYWVSEREDEGR
ncbi:MAG: molybdenum cofactor biosynthesis protein MoaE [Candidatus Bathyarchaeia archaeon]